MYKVTLSKLKKIIVKECLLLLPPELCFSVHVITQLAFACSNLTIETLEQGVNGVFIVNIEHI